MRRLCRSDSIVFSYIKTKSIYQSSSFALIHSSKYQTQINQFSTNVIPKDTLFVESKEVSLNPDEYRAKHEIVVKGTDPAQYPPFTDFHSTPFSDKLKNVFIREKYTSPTPIQAQAWPIILDKRDVISVARTGSGKTCGFLLPALHDIIVTASSSDSRKSRKLPKVIVIAPTRELVVQIEAEADKYAGAVGMNSLAVYGGSPRTSQIFSLRKGVDIVVGTPGRINDLVEDGALNLTEIRHLVLDEADRMLDMGFEPQIRSIVDAIPPERQTVFFTATWPRNVQQLAMDFVNDPVLIAAGQVGVLNANKAIEQNFLIMKEGEKFHKLFDLLSLLKANSLNGQVPKTIIFMSRKVDCDQTANNLNDEGYKSEAIHGDLAQNNRTRALDKFRSGRVRVLVATDVAARGLDITDIEVVINFDFPDKGLEDYVHRIGRTARGERTGRSFSFLTSKNQSIANELIELLERSDQVVSKELIEFSKSRGSDRSNGSRVRSDSNPSRYRDNNNSRSGGFRGDSRSGSYRDDSRGRVTNSRSSSSPRFGGKDWE
eukprot:gene19393-25264_t